ncbi:hypothetical protein PGT21_008549 [Puccinia graminis f. sp. tritici]|uniref:Uncharacterized protein n=1 Tax=Puccinia graminis f. sp. tritici TaxID=56615 RepID=A0A5B0PKT5_PUCGR|nr:hypothetical protein PGT21_008549 [Puccinia graminis f. sp. tritici]
MPFHALFRSFHAVLRVFIFLTLAIAHWPVVSAGAGFPAGEIASPSDQFGRLVEARRPGESRSPRYRLRINSDPWSRSGTTDPVLMEGIFPSVSPKSAKAESSTGISSKRRKLFDYPKLPKSPPLTENISSPRRKVKTGPEAFPMEVDEGLETRKEEGTYRSLDQEVRAGAEELQKGLSKAFGERSKIRAEIEGSGIFEVTQRLLNMIMHHDLGDSALEDEDAEILHDAFNLHMPPDSDLFGRNIFWDDLEGGKKPEFHENRGTRESFASKLQSHQNKINRKLLGLLTQAGSEPERENGRRILEIAKQYHEFLDGVDNQLTFKPISFIEQLTGSKRRIN